MSVIATDDYSGDLSAYTQLHSTAAAIVSGALQGSSNVETGIIRNSGTYTQNQYSQFVIKSTTSGIYYSATLNATGTASAGTLDGYRCSFGMGSGDTYISRVDNASGTDLTSGSGESRAVNDVLKGERSGSSLIFRRNGTSILSTTDSTYLGGRPGIEIYNVGIVDDAEFGDDSSGGSTPVSASDSATGSSSISVAVTTAGSDSASGTSAVAIAASAVGSDSAAAADAASLGASLADSDGGTGFDGAAAAVSIAAADSAAGSDGASVDTGSADANPSVGDSASGSDSVSVAAALATSDSAAGSDSAAPTISLSPTDAAAGSDAGLPGAQPQPSDSATGSEEFAAPATVSVADGGAGADALVNDVATALADSATGSDAIDVGVLNAFGVNDSATGSDSVSVEEAAAPPPPDPPPPIPIVPVGTSRSGGYVPRRSEAMSVRRGVLPPAMGPADWVRRLDDDRVVLDIIRMVVEGIDEEATA